ncbi:ATPase, AAA family [Leptospira yanagawae serovar Saopaulo str. Sao Paulo = ATCC 700523]|uniref:ATPase, AAA family n=1 Tax=Leptospira yanagawae serovar Saopaulo str. Sao Paulo = ATCC 700523 TaxID=1249483 RepID=A0A5E8HDD1_9LEPT|nr:AAA family ATPase [Leptospira yanagawae]EOQ88738.1 ATPase, AAA family [Leptospira yanagawae serovar Saopaulo str. Sao Paulo = ATCC 700523]
MTTTPNKLSASPTIPPNKGKERKFDISHILEEGPLPLKIGDTQNLNLDEKLRKAYFWITNFAIINPFYDIEYNDTPPLKFSIGDSKSTITLPTAQSYSSFVLLPLISLIVKGKCLLVGGPGRGKTASAILMGILAGYSIKEIKRSIQHGQPQMTITDLLGNPLPSDMMQAKSMDEIKIAWRKWLGMQVKIIDEYNRIPTRTQSALLTIMGDNYAEIYDQIYECPEAAWYLTANDDAGGGTYQVIEALRDRIDVVVKAPHFNTRFIKDLIQRVEEGYKPESLVPKEIIFTEEEMKSVTEQIKQVQFPAGLRRRMEFFASQFEFMEYAGEQLEYKTKDTAKLSASDFSRLSSLETGKDKIKDIGSQTKNGLSVRAIFTCINYAKALAYFRGLNEVTLDDLSHVLPFVLHDKLVQNIDSPFFEEAENQIYRSDRVSWIRKLFTLSLSEYERLGLDKNDKITKFTEIFELGLEGLSAKDTKQRLVEIEKEIESISKQRKLYGHMFDDLLNLKYLHQRYTNYLKWVESNV